MAAAKKRSVTEELGTLQRLPPRFDFKPSEELRHCGAIHSSGLRSDRVKTNRDQALMDLDHKMNALSQEQSALVAQSISADKKAHETALLEGKYQQLRQERGVLMKKALEIGPALEGARDDQRPPQQESRCSSAKPTSRVLGESTRISEGDGKNLQSRLQKWWASRMYTWL